MNEGVPKGWSQTRLGEVVNLFNGKAGGIGGSWLRVFKTRHVYDGYVRLSNPAFAPDERASSIPKGTYLCSGDTLTPNMAHGTIGRVAFVREAAESWTVDGQIMVLRPKDGAVVGRYVYDWMSRPESKRLLVNMEKGGAFDELRGQTHIYRDDVASIQILLPPVPEQRKIAEVLSSIDDTIEATQGVIDQLHIVKKATMAELLTRGLPGRHTRFKQTEIGDLPEQWEVKSVVELASPLPFACVGGPFGSDLTTKHYSEAGVPVIRGTNLNGGDRWLTEANFVFVTEQKADELRRNLAYAGDIIFTQRGTLGQVARIRMDSRWPRFLLSQSQMKLTVDDRHIDPDFVTFFFQSSIALEMIARETVATGIPHINLGILRAFRVPVPSLAEQRAIVSVLAALEEHTVVEVELREHLRLTKSALLSVLLTGELRVTPDPEPA